MVKIFILLANIKDVQGIEQKINQKIKKLILRGSFNQDLQEVSCLIEEINEYLFFLRSEKDKFSIKERFFFTINFCDKNHERKKEYIKIKKRIKYYKKIIKKINILFDFYYWDKDLANEIIEDLKRSFEMVFKNLINRK